MRRGLHQHIPPLNRDLQEYCAHLGSRLQAGSHLILYGPRGAGKSTLLKGLCDHFEANAVPWGLAPHTTGLADIVAALRQAYPHTSIDGLGKRAAKVRLRLAAEQVSGVLLLDHATAMTTQMLGYLRRLRGGIVGALLVADIDTSHERERLRAWRVGALSVRMPETPNRRLQLLLAAGIQRCNRPAIEPRMARQILCAARGRIGWLHECVRRLPMPEYWRDGRLHSAVLCTDTEIATRESRPGPRLRRSRVA